MTIINPGLKFNRKLQPLQLTNINYIMLHHTAHPTWNILDVHNYHKNSNKWIGIGYNFFIEQDGTVYEARGFNVGAGATGYNKNSIHICFAGNFENNKPTDIQIKNGKKLVKYILSVLNNNEIQIIGHKDIGNTVCPGRYFPLQEFKNIKSKGADEIMLQKLIDKYGELKVETALIKLIESVNNDGKPSEWAENELQEAINNGITDGTNPKMFATRQEVAIMVNRSK